jgi:DNA-directed RNA polymerase III subunit RPC3
MASLQRYVPSHGTVRGRGVCTCSEWTCDSNSSQRVFSVLARHGRQTLAAIVRASYLNGRQIKYGIAILLQQNVIFHSANDASVAYYEIDWQNAYALVRLSKVVSCVEDRLGKKAGNVVSNLLALGHSRISDLTDAYFPPESNSDDESDNGIPNGAGAGSKRKRANGTEANGTATKSNGVVNGGEALDDAKPTMNGANGTTVHHEGTEEGHDEIASADELINIIQKLMERGWIMTMTEAQYLSPGDIHDMLQKEAIDDYHAGSAPTGIKGKKELHAQTLAKKRDMRDGWLQIPKFFRNRPTDNHLNGSSKRVKLNAPNGSAAAANAHSPVDDLVIRVNPEKINVAMRTDQLVQLAEQRIGSTTASVYKLMLRIIENATARCYEEWPEPPPVNGDPPPELPIDPRLLVTARDVAKSLPRDFDICDGLDPHAIIAVTRKGHVRSANILSQPVDPADLRLDQLTELVDQHIQLLAMDPFRFATWNSRAGFSQWQIEFDNLAQKMIQDQIEKTVSSRKGRVGVKLVRSLRKKGKLDERATCNVMVCNSDFGTAALFDLWLIPCSDDVGCRCEGYYQRPHRAGYLMYPGDPEGRKTRSQAQPSLCLVRSTARTRKAITRLLQGRRPNSATDIF